MSEQGKELMIASEEYEAYLEIISNNNTGADPIVKYPLYFGCYKSALTGMFENIVRIKEKRDKYLEYRKASKDKYVDFSDNANNIIAFCGGRGSGKTTALKEFQRILRNFGNQYEKKWWLQELNQLVDPQDYENKEIRFTVLESIDASLLIDKEDIIELILAQMYDKVENIMRSMHYDNDKKLIGEFVESFETVYKNYHKLRKGESGELGDSAAVILKNMSSGPKIREAFAKLLDMFFELQYPDQGAEQYLVVTIDDLDLNIKHGYEMLEQIHKYLSDYRIIVLTAVDFEQLSRVCELYFSKQYDVKSIAQNANVETLARDYLLKAIPLSNRIYMMDSRNFIGKVKVVLSSGEQEFVKDFIMKKLSRKLGIYYDIKDLGRHFSLPVTVRELVSYNDFLDSLYTLDQEEQTGVNTFMSQYDHNHTRMNRDITERMANQSLTRNSKKDFDSLVEVNILKRSRFTVDLCNKRIDDERQKVSNTVYQYGNLLEILYKLEAKGDKKFKNCILAFFTSEMTREYYSCFHNEPKKQKRSKDRLKQFRGAAFGNEWLGRIIPLVPIEKVKGGIANIGYIKRAQINFWKIPIPLYENEDSRVPLTTAVMQSIRQNRIIEMLGCIILFCSNSEGVETSNFIPKIIFEIKTNQIDGQTKYDCSISFDSATVDFDLLGFIGKEWDDDEIVHLTDNIITGIRQGIKNLQMKNGNKVNAGGWKDDAWVKLIKEQMKAWSTSNLWVFPFYQLDLAYNVLTRARTAGITAEETLEKESIYETIQIGYGYIAAELIREDLQYGSYGKGFYKKFVESPFIQKFGIKYSDEICARYNLESQLGKMPRMFAEVLGNAIKTMKAPNMDVEENFS